MPLKRAPLCRRNCATLGKDDSRSRGDARHVISMRHCNDREKKATVRTSGRLYPNDAMTAKVRRALNLAASCAAMTMAGWWKTGELIGPDPKIERPLSKAQLGKATVRLGRPPKLNRKQSTTLRLDPEVIERFRKSGPGWQTRMGEVLRRAAKRSAPRR